jgi:Xaa-Pro aminopeptidase
MSLDLPEVVLLFSGCSSNESYFIPDIYYWYYCRIPIENSFYLYNTNTLYYPEKDLMWNNNFHRLNYLDNKVIQKPLSDLIKDLWSINPKTIWVNSCITTSNSFKYLNRLFKINLNLLEKRTNVSRCIKTKDEINLIRNSCYITSSIFRDIISAIREYRNEREIVTDFEYLLKKKSGDFINSFSYLPICSNGVNNSILHYKYNRNAIHKDNLILLDAGCKINGYCSDITRTFPSSGKFTEKQLDIYNIVYKCYQYLLEGIRNGTVYNDLESSVRILMMNEMVKLGFFNDNKINKLEMSYLFMPHALSHSIGLETHDYPMELDVLKTNMIITIEPGIYFHKDSMNDPKINREVLNYYKSIGGIRLEDVILIKKNSVENLVDIPISPKDIENMIK